MASVPNRLRGHSQSTWAAGMRLLVARIHLSRGLTFGLIIVSALLAFEVFNYSTTEFALTDLLGDLRFLSIRWSTILALAFCGIDFAGIARLLTPEKTKREPLEVWYLLGAWFLAATMNAILTWWAVSLALLSHPALGNEILGREALVSSVPLFVAILVWLIRVLMIGTFTLAGTRLFTMEAAALVRSPGLASRSVRPDPGLDDSLVPTRFPQSVNPAPKPPPTREGSLRPQGLSARSSLRVRRP